MTLTKPIGLLLTVLLLAGCTHTRHVGEDETADTNFDQLHQTLEGRTVDLHLRDERTMASTALFINRDTTYTLDLLNGRIREASNREVLGLTHTRRGKGAIEGAVLGGAGGLLVGLAAGLALTSVRDSDVARTSVGYYVAVPTTFFTVVGIGAGSVLGARKGSRDHYVYPEMSRFMTDSETIQPMAPATAKRD